MKTKRIGLFYPTYSDKSVRIEIRVDLNLNDYLLLPLSLINSTAIPKTSQLSLQVSDTERTNVDAKKTYGERFHGFAGVEWDDKQYGMPVLVTDEGNAPVIGRKGLEVILGIPETTKAPLLWLLLSAFGGWWVLSAFNTLGGVVRIPPGNTPELSITPRGLGMFLSLALMLAGVIVIIIGIKFTVQSIRNNNQAKKIWETFIRDWGQ